MLVLSGPGTKNEWWPWMGAIWMLRGAVYLGLAAAAMSASSVLVVANSLRLRAWQPSPAHPFPSARSLTR